MDATQYMFETAKQLSTLSTGTLMAYFVMIEKGWIKSTLPKVSTIQFFTIGGLLYSLFFSFHEMKKIAGGGTNPSIEFASYFFYGCVILIGWQAWSSQNGGTQSENPSSQQPSGK